jgi:hypothetical protein
MGDQHSDIHHCIFTVYYIRIQSGRFLQPVAINAVHVGQTCSSLKMAKMYGLNMWQQCVRATSVVFRVTIVQALQNFLQH